jgi:diguanylate cyclase (GGDEF)-like protein/PAS domain S-box-containing protein
MFSRLINPISRITFGLVSLTVSLILLSTLLGIFPDAQSETTKKRELIAESISVNFSAMANTLNSEALFENLLTLVDRHPEIISVGVRETDDHLLLVIGEHENEWNQKNGINSTVNQITVPLYGEGSNWGQIEFCFQPLSSGVLGFIQRTEITLCLLMAVVGFGTFYVYLRFVLRQLDPTRVVPRRVRDALDTLGEGLIVVNKDQKIVLANRSFLQVANKDESELIGKNANDVTREAINLATDQLETPWEQALNGESIRGRLITGSRNGQRAAFMVSSSPIVDNKGVNRGAIASFEDVTQLERKKSELESMLLELDASSSEIKRQNRELELLATRDSLTGCINRRAFFDCFDQLFEKAVEHQLPIAAFMVDIDHFKAINDNHGHATGDEVLIAVANLLQNTARQKDVVCRYGGEEFSILLPNTTIHQACVIAEQIRCALKDLKPSGIPVTTSIGVSALCQGSESPEAMLDQADKCLYVAKRNGRNQVVRWDDVPNDIEVDESQISRVPEESVLSNRIPFHAVTALISALAYRDQETAAHCRRVADLCVAVSEGLLSAKDCYLLETAGLLHDIGKIGVPDSLLRKSTALTPDELAEMKKHERLGIELVHTSFASEDLDNILGNYRTTHIERIEKNLNISLAARILSIADAFDSMTQEKKYREKRPQKEAFAELRKCAGTQFDPELVERFIQVIKCESSSFAECESAVSKEAALSIGIQIERLADALDSRDREGIGTIALRLTETASQHGVQSVADKANEITREIELDGELYDLIRCTIELMDLCRSSQRSLIESSSSGAQIR